MMGVQTGYAMVSLMPAQLELRKKVLDTHRRLSYARAQNEGSPCALGFCCHTLCVLTKVSPIALCRMKSRE